jgi:diguanylate cyclase (GGDEF)-like protein
LGGEEFSVLLPGNDSAGADAFTRRVRLALVASVTPGLPSVRVSAGVHAAIAPPDIQTMLQRADAALYDAKRAGRDRTAGFSDVPPVGNVCGEADHRSGPVSSRPAA